MENSICQSCGVLITFEQLGTNKDGGFIDKVTMEQYIEMYSKYGEQAGMINEGMKEHCMKLFPTLKRWQCTCNKE